MTDFARLGLAVDSSEVERGTITLNQLTGAAGQAERAARNLAGAEQVEAAGMKSATAAAQAHTAALHAQQTVIRSTMQQRTMMIYQLNDIGVSLASGMNPMMVAIQQGSQILQGGLAPALRTIGDLVTGVVAKFAGLGAAAAAVGILFVGWTRQINEGQQTIVSFGDVAIATFQLVAEGFQRSLGGIWNTFSSDFMREWDKTVATTNREINAIIGVVVGGYEAIKAVWSDLPNAMGYVMYEVSMTVSNIWARMLRSMMVNFNIMMHDLQKSVQGATGFVPTVPLFTNLPREMTHASNPNPYASAQGGVDRAQAAFGAAMSHDYVGDALGAVGDRARDIAAAREETEKLGGAASAANDNVKKLADDGLAKVGEFGKSILSSLSSGFSDMFKGLLRGTTSLTDALGSLLGKLGDLFIDQAFNMLFSGGGGGIGGWLAGLFHFANGGVFNAGQQIHAFADGGIVSRPTLFPMSNGPGLMGEAGPEAIMPLRRGPDGKLGVAQSGRAATSQAYNDNRSYNIDARGAQIGVADQIVAAIKANNKQLPSLMADIRVRQG